MKRVYEFSNIQDMIDLAREVQSRVYWSSSFYLLSSGSGDAIDSVGFSAFWDICDDVHYIGATAVSIDGDDVEFIYGK